MASAHDLELVESGLLASALAAGWGAHKGNNMAAEGMGFIEFWMEILAAPALISYVSWSIVLLAILFIVAAAVFVVRSATTQL